MTDDTGPRKTIGIVGGGVMAARLARGLVRGEARYEVVLCPTPWEDGLGEGGTTLMESHAPVGGSVVRAGTLAALSDAHVVLLAWDPMVRDGDTSITNDPNPGRQTNMSALRTRPVLGREILGALPTLLQELDDVAPEAILVTVTEPIDPLTTIVHDLSRRPNARIIGIGTLPDTLHFRALLGRYYGVAPESVYVQVLGAHAIAEVPLWSRVLIGGHHILREELLGKRFDADRMWKLFKDGQARVYRAMQCGDAEVDPNNPCDATAPLHAILCAVEDLTDAILHDERKVLTVSMRLTGTFGLSGICLSLPCVVGADGIDAHIIPHLDDTEEQALHHAAEEVATAVAQLPGNGTEHASLSAK